MTEPVQEAGQTRASQKDNKPGPKANMYTPEIREIGLVAYAARNGNRRKAHEDLAAQGIHIPETTLESWAQKTHREDYQRIREQIVPHLKLQMAERYEQVVSYAQEIKFKLLERLDREADHLDLRDVGKNLQQVAITGGIASQHAGALRGDSTPVVHEVKGIDTIIRSLKRIDPELVLEAEAEEIGPAEIEAAHEIDA